jgi:hypothetical protein
MKPGKLHSRLTRNLEHLQAQRPNGFPKTACFVACCYSTESPSPHHLPFLLAQQQLDQSQDDPPIWSSLLFRG